MLRELLNRYGEIIRCTHCWIGILGKHGYGEPHLRIINMIYPLLLEVYSGNFKFVEFFVMEAR